MKIVDFDKIFIISLKLMKELFIINNKYRKQNQFVKDLDFFYYI